MIAAPARLNLAVSSAIGYLRAPAQPAGRAMPRPRRLTCGPGLIRAPLASAAHQIRLPKKNISKRLAKALQLALRFGTQKFMMVNRAKVASLCTSLPSRDHGWLAGFWTRKGFLVSEHEYISGRVLLNFLSRSCAYLPNMDF
jgi:hypothetical protein